MISIHNIDSVFTKLQIAVLAIVCILVEVGSINLAPVYQECLIGGLLSLLMVLTSTVVWFTEIVSTSRARRMIAWLIYFYFTAPILAVWLRVNDMCGFCFPSFFYCITIVLPACIRLGISTGIGIASFVEE